MTEEKIRDWVSSNLRFHQLNRECEKKFGISMVQYHLLKLIKDRPGIASLSLAKTAGAHPSSLTQSLRRLTKKKAIFIGPHPKDARRKIISMTRTGLEYLRAFEIGMTHLSK